MSSALALRRLIMSREWQRVSMTTALVASLSASFVASAAETARVGKDVEEVIVTAQKRAERLQDVPVPVTAMDAGELLKSSQTRLQDYYTKVPGLNLITYGNAGGTLLSIRGVTTGGNINPTVGIVVDDLPFGASTTIVNGALSLKPDFDPSELERIEVLRGPQGTLYGASSLGGLVKFVTVDPSVDGVFGRMQVGTVSVREGDDLGYSVRGSLNVPLSEQLAVRVGGSTRRDPGYIDNVQTGEKDVNSTDTDTARLAALWQPSDALTFKLSAFYQKSTRDGSFDSQLPTGPVPGLGELEQSKLKNTGTYEQELQAYSLTATAKLGHADLTSLTGYSVSDLFSSADAAPAFFVPVAQAVFGVSGVALVSKPEATKFNQELRLAMPLGERVDWLIGAFYTDEETPGPADTLAVAPNGTVRGTLLHSDLSSTYKEYAAFTDFTFKLSKRWDVQLGARGSHNRITYTGQRNTGPLLAAFRLADPNITPAFDSEDDAFTYLLTPRFRLTDDIMMYARVASGYRPGGPNALTAPFPGVPTDYGHDKTENYELGVKAGVLDGRLSFEASVYHIDWKDVQLQVRDANIASVQYIYNVGAAESEGLELALDINPLDGMTITASGAYNEAEITKLPANIALAARPGDRLPYSARRSGYLSVEQEFPLGASLTGVVAASVSYVGERKGRFFTAGAQETFPSYKQIDLRGGATMDSWTINLFVNNAGDERGVLRSGRDSDFPYLVTYIQPRTFGLSLTKEF